MAYNKIYELLVKSYQSEISKILRIDTFNRHIEYISRHTYRKKRELGNMGYMKNSSKLFTIQLSDYIFNLFGFKIAAVN